jgi:tetratricopeptide (TPR) repeat protein
VRSEADVNKISATTTNQRHAQRFALAVKLCALALIALPCAPIVRAEEACGSLQNSYGPYDYNDPVQHETYLRIVETAHFTSDVETLKRGRTGSIMGDIDYTLRASPNHHRALYAMARYYLQHPDEDRNPVYRSADCYFDRALRFRPNDGAVYLVYGLYLAKKGLHERALTAYTRALELMPDSAEAHYDIGLLYAEMKDYAAACRHASEAQALGYPLQGLERQVRSAGYDPSKCEAPRPADAPAN